MWCWWKIVMGSRAESQQCPGFHSDLSSQQVASLATSSAALVCDTRVPTSALWPNVIKIKQTKNTTRKQKEAWNVITLACTSFFCLFKLTAPLQLWLQMFFLKASCFSLQHPTAFSQSSFFTSLTSSSFILASEAGRYLMEASLQICGDSLRTAGWTSFPRSALFCCPNSIKLSFQGPEWFGFCPGVVHNYSSTWPK